MSKINGHDERVFVDGKVDLYTPDGTYLFSVAQGSGYSGGVDHRWRILHMYKDRSGNENVESIEMIQPDYNNGQIGRGTMNLKECPFCRGRSFTCEDCCGSGYVEAN